MADDERSLLDMRDLIFARGLCTTANNYVWNEATWNNDFCILVHVQHHVNDIRAAIWSWLAYQLTEIVLIWEKLLKKLKRFL